MRERQLSLGPEPAIVETVLVVALSQAHWAEWRRVGAHATARGSGMARSGSLATR